MKKLVILLILLIGINPAFSQCGCEVQNKCLDLMSRMFSDRATLYNVLNLTADQQKCKDVIDLKRHEQLSVEFQKYEQERFVLANMCKHQASEKALNKQEKVVKDIEKCMKKINNKYDKEFKSVLNGEQKAKLRKIRSMEKKEIKRCQKNKRLFKPDPHLEPFGERMLKQNIN